MSTTLSIIQMMIAIIICLFLVMIVAMVLAILLQIMNDISEAITNLFEPKNNKRRVTFTTNEVKYYHLSNEERKMKKDTIRRVRRQSRHYRQMDYLCYAMDNLKINPK